MHKNLFRSVSVGILLIYICTGLCSCVSIKNLKLLQDIPDTTKLSSIPLPKFVPPVVHPGDILSISIITTDLAATSSITAANSVAVAAPTGAGSAGSSTTTDNGYLVSKEGYIEMPEIGRINVDGLTIPEVKEAVRKQASEFFKNPIIVVKSKNLKFTLLGEITRPGIFNITNEKVTLTDALAYSGDFTAYGRRDNLLLIRQNDDNTLSSIRIDLRDSKWLKSPYYYLQNNDVIYVEPSKAKAIASDAVLSRNISFIGVGLSLLTTMLVVFRR